MKTRKNISNMAAMAVLVLAIVSTAANGTIYVDDDAPPGGDGLLWGTAFKYLQDALAAASSGEIWVAQGTYKPDEDDTNPTGTGNRLATFQLKDGVAIRGGYAGFGEPEPTKPDDRNIEAYETILSGDLNGDDGKGTDEFANMVENSDRVSKGNGTDATAILDGFTITAGYGGMINSNFGSPTVRNCKFIRNAGGGGAGMANNNNSSPQVINCIFENNKGVEDGGGMANSYNSSPILTGCKFIKNTAERSGGGLFNWSDCSPILTNCTFTENSVTLAANPYTTKGGGVLSEGGSPTFINCDFIDNESAFDGGGVNIAGSVDARFDSCKFEGNSASESGGGMLIADSTVSLTDCTFIQNSAKLGGAVKNFRCNPIDNKICTFTSCTFTGNSATTRAGAMDNFQNCSPILTDCTFTNNSTEGVGGAMHNDLISSPSITDCEFTDNSAIQEGGGVHNFDRSSPTLTNCTFSNNSSPWGAGMGNNTHSSPTLTNCTFNGNTAPGGGIYNYSNCEPTLVNCILWDGGNEIYNDGSTNTTTITYSDIQGGWSGVGNIDADPMFVDAANDDCHLLPSSPCIDVGTNTPAGGLPPTDIEGNDRIINGIVDMGAFEAPPSCTPVSLDSLTADPLVVPLGNAINFEATIANGCGEIEAVWDFDDGTYDSQSNVTSPVTATKTYTSAGVYTVVLGVFDDKDSDGDNIIVVVYDPTGGFVTGGGWIDSPTGAYTPDPSLTGKANFGFVSKYKKGATVPTGNTEFVFKTADLNFHSSSYDWLVVSGSNKAKFKGAGTINGQGPYKFMLWAGDEAFGGVDTFRIKIWTEGNEDAPVYDNGQEDGPGTEISGGNIIVHTK